MKEDLGDSSRATRDASASLPEPQVGLGHSVTPTIALLLTHLERLRGPSLTANDLIAIEYGWQRVIVGDESRGYVVPRYAKWVTPEGKDVERHYCPPLFTHSVDAALTLVPEGWRVYALQEQWVTTPNEWFAGLDRRTEHYKFGSQIGKACTPAIALCIACLNARHAQGIVSREASETPSAARPKGQEPDPKGCAQ